MDMTQKQLLENMSNYLLQFQDVEYKKPHQPRLIIHDKNDLFADEQIKFDQLILTVVILKRHVPH